MNIVAIDAGHGGEEKGASYCGVDEKNINLCVAGMVSTYLRFRGVKVFETRSTDTTIPLRERIRVINELKPSLLVSIHVDALPNNPEVSGGHLIIAAQRSRITERMSRAVNLTLSRLGRWNVNGMRDVDNKGIVTRTTCPAMIVELGFMTNRGDLRNICNNICTYAQIVGEALQSAGDLGYENYGS